MSLISISREKLLTVLESVQAGLSQREILEQSSCFVFQDERLITYNDEVSCSVPSPFGKGLQGAVKSLPLLTLLQKMSEEEVQLEAKPEELVVKGKKRRAGISMEKDVRLDVSSLEVPKAWKELDAEFSEALEIVVQCASRDESKLTLVCVHLHPKWIESMDNEQILRYKLKIGLEAPVLVRADSLKSILPFSMKEYALTDSWIHFRNKNKLTISCRKYIDSFPEISQYLKIEDGTPITLPKGLVEAVEKAEVFSEENADDNLVEVSLSAGKLRLKAQGVSGWYSESKKLSYQGPELVFKVAPKLLASIVKKYNTGEITSNRMRVDGGKFVYVAYLHKPKGEEGPDVKNEGETGEEG